MACADPGVIRWILSIFGKMKGAGVPLYDSGIRRSAMAANQLQPTGMISSLNS
jgi:hypothetical protein